MRWSMLCCLWHRTTRLVAFGNKLCLKNTSFALGWTALCLLIIMGQSKIYSLVSLKGILDKSPDDQKQCQSGKIAIHSWWWPYTIWWTILHFIYQYSHYEKMYREHIILICYLRQINQNALYLSGYSTLLACFNLHVCFWPYHTLNEFFYIKADFGSFFKVFVQLIQLFMNLLNSIGDRECWLVLLCYVSQKKKN